MTATSLLPPLVPLPDKPSRRDLRDARAMLAPLATLKVPGAAEQLQAVDALIRRLFPRRTADSHAEPVQAQKSRRAGKQRRPIAAEDCMGTCPMCRGRKGFTGPLCCIICTRCNGTGKAPVGVSEHDKNGTLLRGTRNRHRALRGDYATQTGVSILPPSMRGTVPHQRGIIGRVLVGESREAMAAMESWHRDTDWGDCDAIDLSAELEANARRRAKRLVPKFIKGRRLAKQSGRDQDILTERQERRAKSEKRVRRYQREWNKAHREVAERSYAPRDINAAALELLVKMGVDVSAALAAAQPVVDDSPVIAEARRRGDLPPDDLLPAPVDLCMVRVLAGTHAGQTGRYTISMLDAAVVRATGAFERHCGRVARVEFEDGDIDFIAVDDVFPVSQLVGGAA